MWQARGSMNVLLIFYRPLVRQSFNNVALRGYSSRNPLERRSLKELLKSVKGDGGGKSRGGTSKRGGVKGFRAPQKLHLGRGKKDVRWPGLSYPLPLGKKVDLLPTGDLQGKESSEVSTDFEEHEDLGFIDLRKFSDEQREPRKESEKGWSTRGWTSKGWKGRGVGCPERPDGMPLTDFKSIVVETKWTATHRTAGKKRTASSLVLVGNGRGAVGFAVGKADSLRAAIKQAKNRAANYLQVIPVCNGHTLYHNVQTKYCRTVIFMERKVKGRGLSCQRIVKAIAELAGIEDMRAKIVGPTNPLNVVRAALKGMTSQQTYQMLADESGKFVVEYRKELGGRPLVVAVPSKDRDRVLTWLKELQMLDPQVENLSR